jgi:hypothetical protein
MDSLCCTIAAIPCIPLVIFSHPLLHACLFGRPAHETGVFISNALSQDEISLHFTDDISNFASFNAKYEVVWQWVWL